MAKFAFVIHPLDIGLVGIAFGEPNLVHKKPSLVKKAFEWLPSFSCSDVTGVKSLTGKTLAGNLLYFALLPEQIISLDDRVVLDKLLAVGNLAKDLGAGILGLGAYAAQVGKKGVVVANELKMPVTTGTHYTIFIAIESVLTAAKKIGIAIENSNVAIIGATGAIGRVCAHFFANKVARLTLVARNSNRLINVCGALPTNGAQIVHETDVKKAIREADICIMATTTPTPLVDTDELRPGALICDISRPRNVSRRALTMRSDVLVLDGGIVQPPGELVDFNFYFGLPKGLAYACMAETMILALEDKLINYSIGGDVSIERVNEIGNLGRKHGFKLAKMMSFDAEVPDEIFESMRKYSRSNAY